jgi:hypothetical protein
MSCLVPSRKNSKGTVMPIIMIPRLRNRDRREGLATQLCGYALLLVKCYHVSFILEKDTGLERTVEIIH